MEIDASWDGILGWRSMHAGMAIAAFLDGDHFVLGWRSLHPRIVIMHPGMAIIATRDGDRCIPGWISLVPRPKQPRRRSLALSRGEGGSGHLTAGNADLRLVCRRTQLLVNYQILP